MKPTVLIVEDDKAVRDSLRMVLEAYGYAVKAFASGEELLGGRGHADGACLILDVNLPGASGLKILEGLRAKDVATPAIVVSGRATEEMHLQAEKLSALALLDKPIDIDGLLTALGSIEG